jgi:hypothetical protein
MALVIPWLFEREYQQHRNLGYYGLPETFEAWREMASALADLLRQAEPLSGPSDNRDDRQVHYADHRIVRRRRVPSSPPTSRSQPSDRTAQSLQPHPPTPSQCLTRQSRLVGYPFSWRCLSLRIRHPEPTGSRRATPTSLFQRAAGHFRLLGQDARDPPQARPRYSLKCGLHFAAARLVAGISGPGVEAALTLNRRRNLRGAGLRVFGPCTRVPRGVYLMRRHSRMSAAPDIDIWIASVGLDGRSVRQSRRPEIAARATAGILRCTSVCRYVARRRNTRPYPDREAADDELRRGELA